MLLLWWAATFFYLFLLFCLFVQAFMSAPQSNTYSRFKLFINSLIFLFWTFFPSMKHYNATDVKPTSTDINRSAAVDRRSLTTRTTETTELREGWAEINLECEAPVYVTMQMHTVSVQPLCFRTVHSFSLSRSSVSRMCPFTSVLTSAGSRLRPSSSSLWWSAGSGLHVCSAVCSFQSGQTGYSPEIRREEWQSCQQIIMYFLLVLVGCHLHDFFFYFLPLYWQET